MHAAKSNQKDVDYLRGTVVAEQRLRAFALAVHLRYTKHNYLACNTAAVPSNH